MRDEQAVKRRLALILIHRLPAIRRLNGIQLGAIGRRHHHAQQRLIPCQREVARRVERVIHLQQRIRHLAKGQRQHAGIARLRRRRPGAGIRTVSGGDIPFDESEVRLRGDLRIEIAIGVGVGHRHGIIRSRAIHAPVQRGRRARRFVFDSAGKADRLRAPRNLRLVLRALYKRRDVCTRRAVRRAWSSACGRAHRPVLPAAGAQRGIPQFNGHAAAIGQRFPNPSSVCETQRPARPRCPFAFIRITHIIHRHAQRVRELHLLPAAGQRSHPRPSQQPRERRVLRIEPREVRRDHEIPACGNHCRIRQRDRNPARQPVAGDIERIRRVNIMNLDPLLARVFGTAERRERVIHQFIDDRRGKGGGTERGGSDHARQTPGTESAEFSHGCKVVGEGPACLPGVWVGESRMRSLCGILDYSNVTVRGGAILAGCDGGG